MKRLVVIMAALMFLLTSYFVGAEEKKETEQIPDSVLNIAKENTYTNPLQDLPYLQPSPLAQELLDSIDVTIENPDLIKILNESTINHSKLAIAFRASIYLGEWPLSYDSTGTEVNWEYQKVNTNYTDNRGGDAPQKMTYHQEQQKKVTGGLTAMVPNSEAVKKMMMIKAAEHVHLPLSFETVVGQGTRKSHTYNVAPKQVGYLHSYVPAVHEKGKVTYGEVYLTFKGGNRQLEVKNITQQVVSAWIPVQDHLSYSFQAAKQPG